MDSKLAVQQMSGTWQIKHPAIRPLAVQARAAFPRAAAVRYTWVPREQNKRADALGNLALDDPAVAAAKMADAKAMIEAFQAGREREGFGGSAAGSTGASASGAAASSAVGSAGASAAGSAASSAAGSGTGSAGNRAADSGADSVGASV